MLLDRPGRGVGIKDSRKGEKVVEGGSFGVEVWRDASEEMPHVEGKELVIGSFLPRERH